MTDGAVFQGRKRNLSQHKQIRKALGLNAQNYSKVSEDSSLQLFNSCSFLNDMPLAFCIIELVFDAEGHGVDFVFRYCNDEMAVVEGIPVSEMLNRSFYEVFENGDKKWLVTYADVALNGNKHILQDYSPEIDKTLTIYCFQPASGYCACVLIPSQCSAIWRMRLQNYFSVNKKVRKSLIFDMLPIWQTMEISKNLSYEEHIFMSRKQYSKELKLELVKKHLEDGISYWKLGKEYGIEASIIRRWGHKYETFGEDGLEKQNADLCNYSAEFKKKIVLEYLGGDITSQDLAAKYKIHAPSTVRTWIKQYNNPLVFDTFDKAVATNPGATPLLHSDRGYQYTSKAFRRRILAAGMTQSMSRVARCIDNGPMEGFWGLMKREMYYGKKYKTKEELMLAIEKYIDYYTNKRVQRNLGVLTPLEFHEQKLENVA